MLQLGNESCVPKIPWQGSGRERHESTHLAGLIALLHNSRHIAAQDLLLEKGGGQAAY
jgi:hypothetical protein